MIENLLTGALVAYMFVATLVLTGFTFMGIFMEESLDE